MDDGGGGGDNTVLSLALERRLLYPTTVPSNIDLGVSPSRPCPLGLVLGFVVGFGWVLKTGLLVWSWIWDSGICFWIFSKAWFLHRSSGYFGRRFPSDLRKIGFRQFLHWIYMIGHTTGYFSRSFSSGLHKFGYHQSLRWTLMVKHTTGHISHGLVDNRAFYLCNFA